MNTGDFLFSPAIMAPKWKLHFQLQGEERYCSQLLDLSKHPPPEPVITIRSFFGTPEHSTQIKMVMCTSLTWKGKWQAPAMAHYQEKQSEGGRSSYQPMKIQLLGSSNKCGSKEGFSKEPKNKLVSIPRCAGLITILKSSTSKQLSQNEMEV